MIVDCRLWIAETPRSYAPRGNVAADAPRPSPVGCVKRTTNPRRMVRFTHPTVWRFQDRAASGAGMRRWFPICNLQFAFCILQFLLLVLLLLASSASASLVEAIDRAQPKIVKLYGVGGIQDMKGYQTGILISPEGHILTAYSYVLDADPVSAVLADGRRFDAKLLGADPRLEIAVLKIEAAGLPCFDLRKAVRAEPGARVSGAE